MYTMFSGHTLENYMYQSKIFTEYCAYLAFGIFSFVHGIDIWYLARDKNKAAKELIQSSLILGAGLVFDPCPFAAAYLKY